MWINLTPEEHKLMGELLTIADHELRIEGARALLCRLLDAAKKDPDDEAFRNTHIKRYSCHPWTDGDIDIDEDAMVSRGDYGAYVMMWGYVRNEDAGVFAFQTWEEAAKSCGYEIVQGAPGEESVLYSEKLDRTWPYENGAPDWEGAADDAGIEDFEVKEANE